MRENHRQRHALLGLIGGIAEHQTLISGPDVVVGLLLVHSLGDIGRLLFDGDEDVHGLVVEAFLRGIVADLFDGVTDDLLIVEVGRGGDLSAH